MSDTITSFKVGNLETEPVVSIVSADVGSVQLFP